MRKLFFKHKSDERGVMTMEFAVMLPILLMWFGGTFVFFDAFHKWIKAMKATYIVSDMISRQADTSDDFLMVLDGVFDTISQTRNAPETFMEITHVKYTVDPAGVGRLDLMWSFETKDQTSLDNSNAGDKLNEIAPYIPTLVSGESMTVLQTYRPFTPVFEWVGLNGTVFRNRISAPQRFFSDLPNSDHPLPQGTSLTGFDPTPDDP